MNQRIRSFVVLSLPVLLSFASPSPAAAKLKVACTIQDLADIVKEIGGDRVEVSTMTRGKENLHQVSVRPSHLVAVSRADALVQIGLSLETTFIPGLLENARNPRIQPGQPGFINVSAGWTPIEVPVAVSRRAGDIHPQGNPHMNLDPRAGRHIAERVFEGLSAVDPASRDAFRTRLEAYFERLATAEERWAETAKQWEGKKIVVYHLEYNYLAHAYGMQVIGSLEVRPGIPPTPNHLAALVDTMRREKADAILTAIWSNNPSVDRVAEETRTPVVELPNQCGGMPGTDTWIGMMDVIHERLAVAFAKGRAER